MATAHELAIVGMSCHGDHWQLCSRLLARVDVPLLLLLAGGNDRDRARGLDLGADDCLLQPPSSAEFLARVRALLRRGLFQAERRRRSFFLDGDLSVDLARQQVRVAGRPVALTRTEFQILTCLVRHPDQVMSQEQLITQIWGYSEPSGHGSLKRYIHFLRQKLEPDSAHLQRIIIRWSQGYLLRRMAADGQGSGAEQVLLAR
jgi:DNA-binding response OmpR family regulator